MAEIIKRTKINTDLLGNTLIEEIYIKKTIEEQFFECFGIEPKHIDCCKLEDKYWNNEELANKYGSFDNYMKINCKYKYQECTTECKFAYDKEQYPQITDRKLLELIVFLSVINRHKYYKIPTVYTVSDLKNWILGECIEQKESIKTRVKAIFGREDQ